MIFIEPSSYYVHARFNLYYVSNIILVFFFLLDRHINVGCEYQAAVPDLGMLSTQTQIGIAMQCCVVCVHIFA